MLFRSHRNRRLPDRAVEAGTAGRGLRHVAIWLADRGGGGRLAGAVRRAADRLDAGLYRLCAACPFRHARVAGDGRTRTASRAHPQAGHGRAGRRLRLPARSEEHTSELQSLMRISYAVFCLKKKTNKSNITKQAHNTTSKT